MMDNLSVTVHDFCMRKLISLSVDEISLPRYVNWSTNFIGLTVCIPTKPRTKFKILCGGGSITVREKRDNLKKSIYS